MAPRGPLWRGHSRQLTDGQVASQSPVTHVWGREKVPNEPYLEGSSGIWRGGGGEREESLLALITELFLLPPRALMSYKTLSGGISKTLVWKVKKKDCKISQAKEQGLPFLTGLFLNQNAKYPLNVPMAMCCTF